MSVDPDQPPPPAASLVNRACGLLRWHYASSVPWIITLNAGGPYPLFPVPITEHALFHDSLESQGNSKSIVRLPHSESYAIHEKPLLYYRLFETPRRLETVPLYRDSQVTVDGSQREVSGYDQSPETQSMSLNDTVEDVRRAPKTKLSPQLQRFYHACPGSSRLTSGGYKDVAKCKRHWKLDSSGFIRLRHKVTSESRHFSRAANAVHWSALSKFHQDEIVDNPIHHSKRHILRRIKNSYETKCPIVKLGGMDCIEASFYIFDTLGAPHELDVRNQLPSSFGPKDMRSWPLHSVTQYQSLKEASLRIYEAICHDACTAEQFALFKELVSFSNPRNLLDYVRFEFCSATSVPLQFSPVTRVA